MSLLPASLASSLPDRTEVLRVSETLAIGTVGGVLFLPLLLAIKPDSDAKKTLDDLQMQRDRIDRLSKAKGCSKG